MKFDELKKEFKKLNKYNAIAIIEDYFNHPNKDEEFDAYPKIPNWVFIMEKGKNCYRHQTYEIASSYEKKESSIQYELIGFLEEFKVITSQDKCYHSNF